jgi:hypothetical protein
MITQTANLAGLSTAQLVSLQHQILMDFFAPETTDEDRDNLISFQSKLDSCVPHTFVLASLFDVEAMSNDIPDHVYESDPSLEWVTCPCCDGEKWLEVEGNVWTKALFADPRLAYAHRHLNSSYKVCGRCSGTGEVLDDLTTSSHLEKLGQEKTPQTPETPTVDVLIAKVESLLAERRAAIKTAAKDPRSTPVNAPVLAVAA